MTNESQDILDCELLLVEADCLTKHALYINHLIKTSQSLDPDWLETTAQQMREKASKLVFDHGELLGRRVHSPDWQAQLYWRDATEKVVAARERVSKVWMAAEEHALALRYPAGPKGWWHALLRGLGLRKGIDRKSIGA